MHKRLLGCHADRVLVGHGLQNDLASLGVKHPAHLLRDTVRCPPFQVKGHAQSLKVLASLHLGLDIQRGSSLHSARYFFRIHLYSFHACVPWRAHSG